MNIVLSFIMFFYGIWQIAGMMYVIALVLAWKLWKVDLSFKSHIVCFIIAGPIYWTINGFVNGYNEAEKLDSEPTEEPSK